MSTRILACLAALILLPSLAAADARIALVIGNGAYEHQPLDNPPNDAALMAETLERVGFQVVSEINADGRRMKRAVRKFGRLLADAGEDAVGFVFYAGHGVQAKGENFMIPVDAVIEDALDVELEGFPASTVLSTLEAAGNRLNIVVMDACRNNPYKAATRSGGSGLARMDAPSGTLIAYSTAPGKVAADGKGRNSPYTRALARAITVPGAQVEEVFKSVRVAVMDRTNELQVPWESSSLTGSFFFVEKAPEPVAAPEPAAPTAPDNTVELTFWNSIKDGTDAALFESYLVQYPNGLFAGLATAKIGSLKKQAAAAARQSDTAFFQAIQNSNNKADFEAYLSQYPNGTFAALAKARIAAIEQQRQQQIAAATAATQAPTADQDTIFWNQVKNANTKAELQAYLDQFPDGKHTILARAKIEGIEEQRLVAALTPAGYGVRELSGIAQGTGNSGHGGYYAGLCGVGAKSTVVLTRKSNKWEAVFTQPEVSRSFILKGPAKAAGESIMLSGTVQVGSQSVKGFLRGVPAPDNIMNLSIPTVNVTKCATIELAALSPAAAGHPMDGDWIVTWAVEDQFAPNASTTGFCSRNEVGEKRITVDNGSFNTSMTSNKGGSGIVSGTIGRDGRAEATVRVAGTRIKATYFLDLSSGKGDRAKLTSPGWCYSRLSFKRLAG